jgi:hypothetical protein
MGCQTGRSISLKDSLEENEAADTMGRHLYSMPTVCNHCSTNVGHRPMGRLVGRNPKARPKMRPGQRQRGLNWWRTYGDESHAALRCDLPARKGSLRAANHSEHRRVY